MLTQNEKIALITGMGNWHTNDLNGKLASIHLSDGPHGLRAQAENKKMNNDSVLATCFPTASASACSFDRTLLARMAKAIAEEAKEQGVSIVLGPGINIKRSPLCGRNFEYFSEDPYLSGQLSTAYVKAMQEEGIGTSLKHFAGNSQETHRMTTNAQIDERALREIYLAAFEMCVKEAKPATIMASYNRLNGKHSCENRHLLMEILRDDWGYDGCVISDWGACVDLPACIEAGMDLEMPDSHGNHIEDTRLALENATLSEQALNRAVDNITNLVNKYKATGPEAITRQEEHHTLAKEIAAESAVLLKNEGILPFPEKSKILIIGEMAEKVRIQGGGSSHIHTGPLKNIIDALCEQGFDVKYVKGYREDRNDVLEKLERNALSMVQDAAAEGRQILFCGGLTDFTEGEGYDRTTYAMPYNQEHLFDRIHEIQPDITFLSFGGSPYEMKVVDNAKAVLMMYLGGEAVAEAAAELLAGIKNPCGRLAETWPMKVEDSPCYSNFGYRAEKTEDVEYRESIYVGYRYYDTFHIPVRFPFGYGLCYTEYEYSNLNVHRENAYDMTVTCDVTNTGKVTGKEVVQLYVKNPEEHLFRAARELRGFQKLELKPGETKTVTFELDERAFSVYSTEHNRFVVAEGEYEISIGKSVNDIVLSQPVSIESDICVKILNGSDFRAYVRNANKSFHPSREDFERLYGKALSDFSNTAKGEYSMKNSLRQLANTGLRAKCLFGLAKLVGRLMTFGKPAGDPEVMMMIESICDGNVDTIVNQSGGMISHKFVKKLIDNANK